MVGNNCQKTYIFVLKFNLRGNKLCRGATCQQ